MAERDEYEADLFRRYELRIVTLELLTDDLKGFRDEYKPIVDKLRDADLIATALAAKLAQARRGTLSKLQIAIALCALFVPPLIASLTTILVLKR